MNLSQFLISSLLLSVIMLLSCRQNEAISESDEVEQVIVGLNIDPDSFNPILSNSSRSREVFQYLFVRLADYDYESQELKPVLIKALPIEEKITDGPWKGTTAYPMEIREEAMWNDGQAITGEDVLFTCKIAAHPSVPSPGWKLVLKDVAHIEIDELNKKKFTIYVRNTTFQTYEYLLSMEIFPKHFYDALGVLDSVAFEELNDESLAQQLLQDSAVAEFGKQFSSIEFSKNRVEGAGPYRLESYESNQYIVLSKKENYWGEGFPDIDQLESYPERIVFQIIKDATTALTILKNGELDIIDLSRTSFTQFDELKKDSLFDAEFQFYTPQIPRYLVLLLNNEDVRLADKEVRIAFSHLTDVDRIIRQLEGGYARRVNSPIHFSKKEYNSNLGFPEFDIAKANAILDNAGWVDSDGNGIRDKVIGGKKEELSFLFHITGSNISTSLYTIIKDACDQAGISIDAVTKPFGATRSENLVTGDYHMTLMMKTLPPVKRDLYLIYHSSAVGSLGQNYLRYSNDEADALIELIRDTEDEEERMSAYLKVQEIIVEDVPQIFLYGPQLRIVGKESIELTISDKRPGFFVNAKAE